MLLKQPVKMLCVLVCALFMGFADADLYFGDTARVMRQYDSSAGLSQVTVTALKQDKYGYIWVGTQAGLNRFDGYQFTQFMPGQQAPNELAGGFITALCVQNDYIWIGSSTGLSAYSFQSGTFRSFFAKDYASLKSDQVATISCEFNDSVTVTTSDGFAYEIKVSDFSVQPIASALNQAFVALAKYKKGYAAVFSGGVYLLDSDYSVQRKLIEGDFAQGFLNQDRLLLFDKGRQVSMLSLISGEVLWRKEFDDINNIELRNALFFRDTVYVSTSNGIYQFDELGRKLTHFVSSGFYDIGLKDNSIASVLRDNAGDLWIGSESQGLFHYSALSESFGHVNNLSHTTPPTRVDVRSFSQDQQNRLWIGTSSGVYLYQNGRFYKAQEIYPKLSLLATSFVTRVNIIDEQLWVTTRGNGVVRFTFSSGELLHLEPDFGAGPEREFNSVIKYNEQLLFGSRTAGLLVFDPAENQLKPYFEKSLGAPLHVSSLLDVNGELWFGSIGAGLFRFKNGALERIDTSDGLASNLVFMLASDQYNRVWVGSEAGLSIIDKNFSVIKVITRQDGLANDAIWGVVADKLDSVWLGTSSGISQIDSSDYYIRNFLPSDGVQANEFNYNAAWLAPDGKIFLGGSNGFNQFKPQNIKVRQHHAQIALSKANVLAKQGAESSFNTVQMPEQLTHLDLNYDQDIVMLDYTSFDFASADQVTFYYRVIGLSEQWLSLPKGVRQINLIKLEPGEYSVEVYAVNRFNQKSPLHTLSISVAAPWFWSVSAKVVYLSVILLVTYFVIASRMKRYRRVLKDNYEMAELKQRLELSLWASGDELWDWNIKRNKMHRYAVGNRIDYGDQGGTIMMDSLHQYVHPKDCILLEDKLEACIEGELEEYEIAIRVKDYFNNWVWVLDRGKVVSRGPDGRATRIAGALKDIAELKQSQLALQQFNEELELKVVQRTNELSEQNHKLAATLEQLENTQKQLIESEKMASLGNLVAGVAHEINTPLGVAITALSYNLDSIHTVKSKLENKTLQQKDLVLAIEEQSKSYQLIQRNLDRAQQLVSSFKQVAVDQSSEQQREIALGKYLTEIITSLRPMLGEKKIEISVDCPANIMLNTYPGALYQVFTNLLQNSLLHGYEQQNEGVISISISQQVDLVRIVYCDDGAGMSDEMMQKVFDPFVTSKRNQGGSGLGMHIVYNLVTQALKGDIRCAKALPSGVKFIISCPKN